MSHTIEDCYKKHGFPPGFKFKNPKYANRSTNCVDIADEDQDSQEGASVQETARFGFTADQYHHLMALLPPQEQKGSSSHQGASVNSCARIPPTKSGNGSSQDTPIGTKNGNPLDITWVLDTGATDHICNTLSYFSSYHQVAPIPVSLPNGIIKSARIKGTIQIAPSL